MLWRRLLTLNLMNQPLPASDSLLLQLPRLSQPSQNWRELGPCSGLGFGLRGCCGSFVFYPDHYNFLHISHKTVLLSYHSCFHWSTTFNFLQELFLCIYDLAVRCKRPRVCPVLAFETPSSLSLIISSFWSKVRDVHLFLSWMLEAIVGLFSGLISILLCWETEAWGAADGEMAG